MGPNFSPVIAFNGDQVIAMGPLGEDDDHRKDFVQQLDAWIYQPYSLKLSTSSTESIPATSISVLSPDDAAATDDDPSALRQGPGVCWMLPLKTISQTDFRNGRAFAVAVALISSGKDSEASPGERKRGRAIWWGHPIWLTNDAGAWTGVENVFKGLGSAGPYEKDPDPSYFDVLTESLAKFGRST
jgi:hypothetical protein